MSIALALAGILFSNLSWTIVSIALIGAYLYTHSRFVSELGRTNIEIKRTVLDEMVFAGEAAGVRVEILNKDPVTIRGVFEDVLPEGCELSAGNNRAERVFPARSILTLSYSLVPKKRGPHLIEGMRIEREDSFGLLNETQMIEHGTFINAHTRKESFDAARKMVGKEHVEFSGMARSPAIILRALEFDGIRDYAPGDRARDIHWRLLPKLGKLMTKTYRREGALQTLVFIDCSRSMRIKDYKIAKIDHALDLCMQLSNVLISSYHPAGVVTFDETQVLAKAYPSLGRHQFEKIVKTLRGVPDSIRPSEGPGEPSDARISTGESGEVRGTGQPNVGDAEFLSAIGRSKNTSRGRSLGFGVEGAMKELLVRSKGQELLFIVISDLISSRDAVLTATKICRSSGSKMLVIHTYDDWYKQSSEYPDVPDIERLYTNLEGSLGIEARLRSLGASYIRIGPADTSARIVRATRRRKV